MRTLFTLVCLAAACAPAQTRRAVIVGINDYLQPDAKAPRALSEKSKARLAAVQGKPSRAAILNLDGAVRDATELRELLIKRFAFDKNNITLLVNGEATADKILEAVRKHLIDDAHSGDLSLFYYAGHGSRIRNSLTSNPSGKDSTIIPADTLLGVPDIRSKELARIYQQARQKDVQLTVIQDSCFSGAGARGIFPVSKSRAQDEDATISVAERLEGEAPETQGVLVLTASQDYQPAQEITDPAAGTHGAFTWALLQVLATSPVDERADRIFQRTRALMQSKVLDQEPVIFALKGRNERGLFGQPSNSLQGATIAVGYVDPAKKQLELNGGAAMRLYAGCELKRVEPASPQLRIRITEVNGPASSNAEVIAPGQIAGVKEGQLFQMDKWVAPDAELLRVYIGPSLPLAPLLNAAMQLAPLASKPGVDWVTDPTERPATLLVRWDGAQQQWMLRQNRANASDMPVSPLSPDSIAGRIGPNSRFPISVLAPAPAELVRLLKFGDGTANPAVQVVDSPARADYVLVGRFAAPGRVEYAWALPSTTEEEMKRQVGEAHNFHQSPPLRTRPLRSDWFAITDDPKSLESAGRELIAKANELANIVGWLQLQAPSADNKFPYRLLIKDAATGQASQGELIGEKKYKMFLQRDGTMPTQNIAQRWFYVFVIDCFGKGTLAYPDGANLNNQIPRPQDGGQFPEEIPLNRSDFRVTPPYGTDNYFLLTTSTPIEDPAAIFNFEGARTRAVGKGPVSPLERLISNRSTGTRGAISGIPTDWSIERTSFRSVPPVE